METKPPLPPFTLETARQKVQAAGRCVEHARSGTRRIFQDQLLDTQKLRADTVLANRADVRIAVVAHEG